MNSIKNASVYFLKMYVNMLLYFPRLIVHFNLNYNPFLILAHKVLIRILGEQRIAMLTNGTLNTLRIMHLTSSEKTKQIEIKERAHEEEEEILDQVKDDESEEEEKKQKESHVLRWLEPNEQEGEHIALVSYPRSGNSLMRSLLEKITGIYTGCDTRPDRSLSQQLLQMGMKGESVVDEKVWFIKTHYPERSGWKPFQVKKAIVVVRNPWDAIDSYFNMTLTNTHHQSIHESQYERFADRWDGMIKNEIDIWMKFHRFWTFKVSIPIIVVRYEDLLVNRAETLRRVFLFITNKKTLEGTKWEHKIQHLMATSGNNSGPYVPRSGGKIGHSFQHYSKEQFEYILKTANLPLRGFGYDPITQNFPQEIPLPKRQVKEGKKQDAILEINPPNGFEIRKKNDTYGRCSTWYRKSLTEPVVAKDNTLLNMEEVIQARQKKKKQKNKKHIEYL